MVLLVHITVALNIYACLFLLTSVLYGIGCYALESTRKSLIYAVFMHTINSQLHTTCYIQVHSDTVDWSCSVVCGQCTHQASETTVHHSHQPNDHPLPVTCSRTEQRLLQLLVHCLQQAPQPAMSAEVYQHSVM